MQLFLNSKAKYCMKNRFAGYIQGRWQVWQYILYDKDFNEVQTVEATPNIMRNSLGSIRVVSPMEVFNKKPWGKPVSRERQNPFKKAVDKETDRR